MKIIYMKEKGRACLTVTGNIKGTGCQLPA